MPELRWALLIVGLLFLGGLAWWEMRRPPRGVRRQDARAEPHVEARAARQEPGVELLPAAQRSLHSALGPDFELPKIRAHPLEDAEIAASTAADADADAVDAGAPADQPPEPQRSDAPPAEAERRILTLRVVPQPPARFGGRALRQALEASGFAHGLYGIFHHSSAEGRVICSAANLTRPGNFDPASMDAQFFHGLNLFTVLPVTEPARQAFEALAADAGQLAQRLDGIVQDDVGRLLTGARLAELKAALPQSPGGAGS